MARLDGARDISLPAVNDVSFINLGPHHVPEIVKDIPQGHSLINQSGLNTASLTFGEKTQSTGSMLSRFI